MIVAGPSDAATVYPVTATIPVGAGPNNIAIDSGRHTAYVADFSASAVSVIDENSMTVTQTIPVGANPTGVAIDTGSHRVYVTNFGGSSMSVIDEDSNEVIDTVQVGSSPVGVGVDTATHSVFVTNLNASTVQVIDENSDENVGTVDVGFEPFEVTLDPVTRSVFVTNYGDGTVSVIDADSRQVTSTVRVGNSPYAVAVDPGTRTAYVTNYGDGTVSVIDEDSEQVTDTVRVGSAPFGVAVDPGTRIAYVADGGDDAVSVIDETANTVTGTVQVGSRPYGVAVDLDTHDAYVTNNVGDSVSVISPGASAPATTSQSITFTSDAPDPGRVGDTYTVTASGGDSGNPVTFAADDASAGCTVSDNGDSTATVSFTDAGTCLIDADQAGSDDGGYDAAPQAQQTVTVRPAVPTVTSVRPNAGPIAGGKSVVIRGSGFTDVQSVSFGSHAAGFTVDSAGQITAASPAADVGKVDVTVTTSGGRSATSKADLYNFESRPTVVKLNPASGPAAGGATITIKGHNFASGAIVRFGYNGTMATSVTVVSTATLTVVTPAHAAGNVNVYVTTPGGTSAAVTGDRYTFS